MTTRSISVGLCMKKPICVPWIVAKAGSDCCNTALKKKHRRRRRRQTKQKHYGGKSIRCFMQKKQPPARYRALLPFHQVQKFVAFQYWVHETGQASYAPFLDCFECTLTYFTVWMHAHHTCCVMLGVEHRSAWFAVSLLSLAVAHEISADAAIAAVLSELGDIFHTQNRAKNCIESFSLLWQASVRV